MITAELRNIRNAFIGMLQDIKEELQLYIIKLNQKGKKYKNEFSRYYLKD